MRRLGCSALFCSLLGVALLPGAAWAQRDGGVPDVGGGGGGGVSPYITYEDDAPYSERIGGTTITFSSPFPSQQSVTLPFAFKFYESTYTTMLVGSSGVVGFNLNNWVGNGSNHSFPDSFTSGITNMIAPFWDDLFQPTVTSHVEGTAPDRIYILQWKNSQLCCGGVPGAAGYQLWLYEGEAGRFEIHFAPNTFPAGSRLTASIGFQDLGATRGTNLASCNPNCGASDLSNLADRVIVATQDAGLDVFARGLKANVFGIGRVYQGVPFTADVTLASYHGEPIGPFRYQIHLVPIGTQTLNNPIFTSNPVTLSNFQTLVETVEITVPLGTPAGRYRVALVADSDGALTEVSELNNVVFGAEDLLITDPKPDFAPVAVDAPTGNPVPGGTLQVPLTIANVGNLDGTTSWTLVLSTNPAPSADDLILATGTETLALRTEVELSATAPLPATLPAGTYTLGLILDAAQAVAELDEVNNVLAGSTIEVDGGALALINTTLPPAYVGLDYNGRLSARGGNGSYTFTVSSGALPDGLSLLESGQLIGRANAAGEATFSVDVESGRARQTFGPITLSVAALDGPLAIITRSLIPGIAGQPYPPTNPGDDPESKPKITAVGGSGSITFSLGSGAPAGLVLDPDGYLHGVPAAAGRFEVEINATDGTESTTRRLPLWIVDSGRLTLVPTELPEAVAGQSYEASLVVLGQSTSATVTFAVIGGELPSGLSLGRDGRLAGIPGAVGRFAFRVEVTEGAGGSQRQDSAELVLEVLSTPDFSITPSNVPTAVIGQPYEVTFEARRGTAPFTWRAPGAVLPRGLTSEVVAGEEARFRISGTAEAIPDGMGVTTGGVISFPLEVTDALGRRATLAVALRVIEPPVEPTPTEEGGCGCTAAPAPGSQARLSGWLFLALLPMLRRRR